MNLPTAWDSANGAGVVVAVLDTGITQHADLDANVISGYDLFPALLRLVTAMAVTLTRRMKVIGHQPTNATRDLLVVILPGTAPTLPAP